MMYDLVRLDAPAHTTRKRPGRPRMFLIHATRGHTSLALQDDATVNWFLHGPDRGGWGSTADVLISADDDRIIEFRDPLTEHGAWSAGYGFAGPQYQWGADEWCISIELAQTAQQEAFAQRVLDKLHWYVTKRMADWELAIPPRHLTYWNQNRALPVPTGFIGHDETANGIKLGKTDPGSKFPWAAFIAGLQRQELSPPLNSAQRWMLGYVWPGKQVKALPQPMDGGGRAYRIEVK